MKRFLIVGAVAVGVMSMVMGCSKSNDHAGHKEMANQQAASTSTNDVTRDNWLVPEFTYTDQDGKKFGSQDLKGKVYLSNFIFTSCPDVCPPMTANMRKIQEDLKADGLNVEIVSFSVDPETDKPAVLKAFGEKHKADFSNWHFLTGYALSDMEKLARETFKGTVEKQESQVQGGKPLFQHPVQFYLVDGTGKVRKFYNGMNPDQALIKKDVKEVLGSK
ncbi:protein SCO1/2 [Thermoactinomyces sp. DSM 45891]|uniref:SCO family protein n=1 Tax=Thermoactinomyces sp. DSM 45891 TaxID=1761907 RepID=UPI000913FB4B|nr:SCO family protein [Thermoactinomyces sp. DSM 45891]SFX10399.1 protein SCO1/2 [Thermoactinomyces sp. DSM 45891]